MKPKEFDDLVRRRFDQGDFEYNPGNWARLAEQMDEGKQKKRSIMVWWGLPLAGIAASVTLAMGLMFLWHNYPGGRTTGNMAVASRSVAPRTTTTGRQPIAATLTDDLATNDNAGNSGADRSPARTGANAYHATAAKTRRHGNKNNSNRNSEDQFSISYANAVGNKAVQTTTAFDFMSGKDTKKEIAKTDKKKEALPEAVATFKEEVAVKKVPKLSVILSGGINRGSQNNGYMAGATIRKMVNSKVYVESDVAFASTTNTQATAYLVDAAGMSGAKSGAAARGANMESSKPASVAPPAGVIKEQNVSYNLNYVQVTPSIGVKIMKRMSLGAGPDFQQVLADNRPAPSTVERGNIQVAPLFDVGLIGKSEFAVTQKVRAAVSYRKGINNVITPMDKYIERDYLQFQVKCTIFNK